MENVASCSATDCKNLSIGQHQELKAVPTWRHPSDRKGQRMYDHVATVNYCADHERVAKAGS